MEELSTCEYIVSPRRQPKYRLRRALAIVGYILFVSVFLTVGFLTRLGVPMIALAPLLTWILVWFTWRYTSPEFEYSISSGIMTLTRVYGNRTRRKVADIRIRETTMIAPFEGEYIERATAYAPERSLDFTADLQSPDVYLLLYETDDKRRGLLYFEATAKALRALKYYNPATVVKAVRY